MTSVLSGCLPVSCSRVYRVAGLKALNKMDSTNLASIFGPILLKVDKVGKGFIVL